MVSEPSMNHLWCVGSLVFLKLQSGYETPATIASSFGSRNISHSRYEGTLPANIAGN